MKWTSFVALCLITLITGSSYADLTPNDRDTIKKIVDNSLDKELKNIHREIDSVHKELDSVKSDLHSEINLVRSNMHREFDSVRSWLTAITALVGINLIGLISSLAFMYNHMSKIEDRIIGYRDAVATHATQVDEHHNNIIIARDEIDNYTTQIIDSNDRVIEVTTSYHKNMEQLIKQRLDA